MDREILPSNVTPLHYDLVLEPSFETFKFDGSVTIDLQVNDSTVDSISLNNLEIDIKAVTLDGSITPSEIKVDEAAQVTEFVFEKGTLSEKKSVKLEIKFIGILNDQMAGFYRAKYEDKQTGETKYMATTQMEATDARRAFPCFDEPNLKSTFDVTLISDKHLTQLSNMDVKSETIEGEKKITKFNTTPKMSTYLIAFIVAELKYVESKEFRIPVRIYSTPGDEHLGEFAASLTARTLKFFESTFDIEYPLPKMDMVAVHEFSAGAMENWGLVTYRVVDLLLDKGNSTLDRIQRVAEVIQHELAHQWFGNLVTMDWWEGLWLNEGFATWMSWYSCNEFQPQWNVWQQYVADSLQRALSLDSLRSSHPIEVPVKNADEINQIFDAISYSKGSSLLRMISKWLGEDIFIKGVAEYLNKFKYGNAKTEDLWDSLSEASGKDVTKVMNIWTKQIGYPIVTVNEEGEKISFTQHRFLSTGDVKPEEDETLYPVFLAIKTKDGIDNNINLDEREKTIELKDNEFFKINGNQAGVYVTCYSDERWAKLSKQAEFLSVEDRTGLVADVKSLASSGYTSTTNFLNLISNWSNEESFVVWTQMINSISALESAWVFEDESIKTGLKNYVTKLSIEKAHKLGWEFSNEDSYSTQKLKVLLFDVACSNDDEKAQSAAIDMFNKYITGDKKAIPALIKPSVFNTVASRGGEESYQKLYNIYKNPMATDEKLAALRALGKFKEDKLITKTLSYLLDGTVLSQDFYIPMQGLRTHKEGILAMWEFLKQNWTEIIKKLQPGSPVLGGVLTVSVSSLASVEKIDDVKQFFSDKPTKGFDQTLAQALDTATSKSKWVARDGEVVRKYLEDNGYFIN